MTYQLPELLASDTEETPVDTGVLIAKFLEFTERSISQTQYLIDKGMALQSQSKPLQPLADPSNVSYRK